ncbi:helix-turn-helix domain-containing protein [Leptospira fluminis]|nr:helix-turn-helix domain-containing protein [Leptospira fluminis]
MKLQMEDFEFVALSPLTKKLLDRIRQTSTSELPVLVLGDVGTGKSFIGRIFHDLSREKFPGFQFVDFGLAESDAESNEIFSSLEGKEGFLIVVENFSKLTPNSQVQLLQKIRNEKGKNRYILAESPLVGEKVRQGILQESLFIEIQTLQVQLPSLRERKEDIPSFVRKFLDEIGKRYNRKTIKVSEKLGHFLLEYDYPGNLHQLKNLLEGMVSMHNSKTLDTKHLPPELFSTRYTQGNGLEVRTGIPLKDYEREIIRKNLILVNGNREKAARILGISERTIYRKITEFELFESNDGKTLPPS